MSMCTVTGGLFGREMYVGECNGMVTARERTSMVSVYA